MIRTILKPLSFIPALLLMYMIFSFSGQTGDVSSQLSYKVSYKIVETANYVFDGNLDEWQIDEWANKINFITRKLAHMTEYFALAIAVSFPLYVYGMHGFLLMLVAGMICVGFACGDEYHQSFVAGRAPSMKDVAIDSVGVFFGIVLVRIVGWTGRKTIFKPKVRKQKIKKLKQPKQGYEQEPYYNRNIPPYPAQNQNPYPPFFYPENDYRQSPYPRSPYQRRPYPDPAFQEPTYDSKTYPNDEYQEPPFNPGNIYDDRWEKEVMHDDIPFAESYPQDFEDNTYANDWGMYETPYPEEPHRVPPVKPENPQKKKKKREKDWLFDV